MSSMKIMGGATAHFEHYQKISIERELFSNWKLALENLIPELEDVSQ